MFFQKVQTVGSVKDFLGGNQVKEVKKGLTTALMSGLTLGVINQIPPIPHLAIPAMASPTPIPMILGFSVADKIINAFNPVVQLLQGMSYPVCFIMLSAGFLVIMTGNRSKGLNLIKWAAIGYIGMQLAPAIMTILVEVGKAMGK